jgi:chorismate mutase
MGDWAADPRVVDLRERIAEADRQILEKANERIELAGKLGEYKLEQGYPAVDRAREEWLIDHLTEVNRGPLSPTGVRQLFTTLIEIGKGEVTQRDGRRPAQP